MACVVLAGWPQPTCGDYKKKTTCGAIQELARSRRRLFFFLADTFAASQEGRREAPGRAETGRTARQAKPGHDCASLSLSIGASGPTPFGPAEELPLPAARCASPPRAAPVLARVIFGTRVPMSSSVENH